MKLKLALLVGLFAFGYAMSASAGAVVDTDGDLVPDAFDNCSNFDNGPNEASNQVDTDVDGFGNACDGDLNNDNSVGGGDFGTFVSLFGGSGPVALEADLTGDLIIGGGDFARFVQLFGLAPGPSGLACAGTTPCTP